MARWSDCLWRGMPQVGTYPEGMSGFEAQINRDKKRTPGNKNIVRPTFVKKVIADRADGRQWFLNCQTQAVNSIRESV